VLIASVYLVVTPTPSSASAAREKVSSLILGVGEWPQAGECLDALLHELLTVRCELLKTCSTVDEGLTR